jgi:hypothetical protein
VVLKLLPDNSSRKLMASPIISMDGEERMMRLMKGRYILHFHFIGGSFDSRMGGCLCSNVVMAGEVL